ncbi:hypothetical protein [Neptunomonas qingdaonensis]|uniref:Uncharacterized protein n=1 Tax=Neptunomonas qingdaonensis TaxID=1045558 RepID=A0A1I2Q6U0_9GAMM|nr:hypothetical protein [Neptunomonas qingdaonensis]SFG24082.1 hypothetical protein SAMN05216175_104267 [Neptunomonas qingdaonensis]
MANNSPEKSHEKRPFTKVHALILGLIAIVSSLLILKERLLELIGPFPVSQSYESNAITDFSISSNPSKDWSYGYIRSDENQFRMFELHKIENGLQMWLPGEAEPGLSIVKNNSGEKRSFKGGAFYFPTTKLVLHPGKTCSHSTLQWVSPSDIRVSIKGAFEGLNNEKTGTTTSARIVLNENTPLWEGNVAGFGAGSEAPFDIERDVEAGDKVRFIVGCGSDRTYESDSTGLSIIIKEV